MKSMLGGVFFVGISWANPSVQREKVSPKEKKIELRKRQISDVGLSENRKYLPKSGISSQLTTFTLLAKGIQRTLKKIAK